MLTHATYIQHFMVQINKTNLSKPINLGTSSNSNDFKQVLRQHGSVNSRPFRKLWRKDILTDHSTYHQPYMRVHREVTLLTNFQDLPSQQVSSSHITSSNTQQSIKKNINDLGNHLSLHTQNTHMHTHTPFLNLQLLSLTLFFVPIFSIFH